MKHVQIFVSYGRGDAEAFARRLAGWIREQGYVPWLDVENGIEVGQRFDSRIEQGIASSKLVVALLSASSVRPEGFCRNELLYAQALRKPILPVRIADVIPPIQIISLNYIDCSGDQEKAFCDLPEAIEKALHSGQSPNRDDARSAEPTGLWVRQGALDFTRDIARHGRMFVGRDWLFETVQQWSRNVQSRVLLVTGDAGIGKSAIAAQMMVRLNVRGVHFCSRDNRESCSPAAWISGLVYQLARQFPAYRKHVKAMSEPDWNRAEVLFRSFVADPLRACESELDIDGSSPWIFVVDGLDEARAVAGGEMVNVLADAVATLPPWLRLILTTRPDSAVIARFRLDGVRNQQLDASEERNRLDLRDYVIRRLASVPDAVLLNQSQTRDTILAKADGNFLFACMTLDALCNPDGDQRISVDEIDRLPQGLSGIYHAMFRKRFGDPQSSTDRPHYTEETRPLLEVPKAVCTRRTAASSKSACDW